MINTSGLKAAKAQALANAKYFGKPYLVFVDTSGNLRVEQYGPSIDGWYPAYVFLALEDGKTFNGAQS